MSSKNHERETYPLIYFPEDFEKIIEFGYIPQKPSKPLFKHIEPILKDKTEIIVQLLIMVLIIPIFLLIGSIYSIVSNSGDMGDAFFPLIIFISITGFILKLTYDQGEKNERNFHIEMELFKKYQREFNKKMEIYDSELEIYKNQLDRYNESKGMSFNEARFHNMETYYTYFTTYPDKIDFSYKKGKSEMSFTNLLKHFFCENIISGFGITEGFLSVNQPYQPDIVYFDEFSGIVIDIEIDEKYSQNKLEPIHCIDRPNDNIRNDFFRKHGWFVLRFSEDQIISDSIGCVVVLFSLLKNYDPHFASCWESQFPKCIELQLMNPVIKELRWSYVEIKNNLSLNHKFNRLNS